MLIFVGCLLSGFYFAAIAGLPKIQKLSQTTNVTSKCRAHMALPLILLCVSLVGFVVTDPNIHSYNNIIQDLKKKMLNDVGMAYQKVCKQGRDEIIVKVNLQSLIPASFSH